MADPTPDFAAEYALGVLEGEELATASRLMLSDTGFARAVDDWRSRLAPMLHDVASQPVPAHIWAGIEKRLQGGQYRDSVVPLRTNPWKIATWVSGAIAASLAAFLIFARPPAPPVPVPQGPDTMMVAQLSGEDMAKPVMASFNTAKNMLKIRAAPHPVPGKSTELWIIPEDGKPRSLGVVSLDRDGEIAIAAAHRPMFNDKSTLAISVEPMGGSPTGAPTGPVIASGTLTTL